MRLSYDAPNKQYICFDEADPSDQVVVSEAEALAVLGEAAATYVGSLQPVIEQEVRALAVAKFAQRHPGPKAKKQVAGNSPE